MTAIRITSVSAPFRTPAMLASGAGLVRRALGLGLLPDREPIERLDLDLVRAIAREASKAGVGRDAAAALAEGRPSGARLRALMDRLDHALVESPVPALELRELIRTYDVDSLAALVGTSGVSLRRYGAGSRTVPDQVAGRLHFVALVTADLAGSYNEVGLRRWWDRPRTALGGRSPREALGRRWDPDSADAVAVAGLALALAGPGSAT